MTNKELIMFTRHLSVMLKAGITLNESLELIISQTETGDYKKTLKKVESEIMKGLKFSDALKKSSPKFNPFYLSLINVGEESGNLDEALSILVKHLQDDDRLKQKIVGASLYPLIILIAMVLSLVQVNYFVLPKLITLLESLDVKMPVATQILLTVSKFFSHYFLHMLIILFASIGLHLLLMKFSKYKKVFHKIMLSLPLIGAFNKNYETARFCKNMAIMEKSGLPILRALDIQIIQTTNLVYKDYLVSLYKSLVKGNSISQELSSNDYKYFPSLLKKMIQVGEKSGSLYNSYNYLSEYYEEELENITKNLSTILEPVLLIVMGALVAFMAFAIITPIYEFTSGI